VRCTYTDSVTEVASWWRGQQSRYFQLSQLRMEIDPVAERSCCLEHRTMNKFWERGNSEGLCNCIQRCVMYVPSILLITHDERERTGKSLCSTLRSRFQLDPASRPGRFTPGEITPLGTHWIEGWVGPSIDLDDVEKRKILLLPGFELRPLSQPARSQSLYRLRYLGSSHLDTSY
jgi:hypothetical protein